ALRNRSANPEFPVESRLPVPCKELPSSLGSEFAPPARVSSGYEPRPFHRRANKRRPCRRIPRPCECPANQIVRRRVALVSSHYPRTKLASHVVPVAEATQTD